MYNTNDTIIALSTPPGAGAISIIRLSGNDALTICNNIFKGKDLEKVESHTLHFGKIFDPTTQEIIDEVVASVFKHPHSYTGEHVVEISCHGSSYIVKEIMNLLLHNGARMANAGEFTMRAFLHGKMDLTQAEAVADLIASESKSSHKVAMQQMKGGISAEISLLRQDLIDFASLIELELDFGEEDVEFADRKKLKELVEQILEVIKRLKASFTLGNAIKTGIQTVIAGKPNAGKSTLLNMLLQEDRAIVSEIEGTTRDTIEEILNIEGIRFRLVDTAGIRDAHDKIEGIGIARTMEKIQTSAILLYIFDVSRTTSEHLHEELDAILKDQNNDTKLLCIANKMDLNPNLNIETYIDGEVVTKENIIPVSARNNMNIGYLQEKLLAMATDGQELGDHAIVSSLRHYEALKKCEENLVAVIDGLMGGVSGDFIAMDIRQALHYLGEITGQISSEDLLESIFTRFCIGK